MERVNTQTYSTETMALRKVNRILWTAVFVMFVILLLQEARYESLKDHVTPQAIYDACNKEIINGRR